MKILRHFTANEEQLDAFPFKRELSMEAYLIENQGVLALDDDVFSSVEILADELPVKRGRKSEATDGRIDLLINYSQEIFGIIELKLGILDVPHLTQLEDYLSERHQVLENCSEVIGPEIIKNAKWIGLLVGNSISSELEAEISKGHTTADGVPIAALTIQRYRSSKGNVYVTTDVYFGNSSANNDLTKYEFDGEILGKSRLVLKVMRRYIADHPKTTFSGLENKFPPRTQGSSGVFIQEEKANKVYSDTGYKRYFIAPDELILLRDSSIAVCNQWGVGNIDNFIKIAKELKYKIKKSKH